jgi:transcriptional regulator with XRE-family HTH domain
VQGKNANAPEEPEALPVKLLAANVVRLRAELGWSTRAFAEHIGMDLRTFHEIEHAKYKTVSISTLERLARGFGVQAGYLVSPPGAKQVPFSLTPVRESISSNLVHWRGVRGWTQEKLAKEANVNRAVIADVERQARNVSLSVLERLARALGVALPQLLAAP